MILRLSRQGDTAEVANAAVDAVEGMIVPKVVEGKLPRITIAFLLGGKVDEFREAMPDDMSMPGLRDVHRYTRVLGEMFVAYDQNEVVLVLDPSSDEYKELRELYETMARAKDEVNSAYSGLLRASEPSAGPSHSKGKDDGRDIAGPRHRRQVALARDDGRPA